MTSSERAVNTSCAATSASRKIQEHLRQIGGRFDRLFVMSAADLSKQALTRFISTKTKK